MKLYQFTISHFCEKARWALDHKNLPYEQIFLIPGIHRFVVRRMAPESAVPMLWVNNHSVQGSSRIIDYLDQVASHRLLGIKDPSHRDEARVLEMYLDDEIGLLLRSITYNVLFKHPKELTVLWSHLGPFYGRAWLKLTMPLLIRFIGRYYDTGDDSIQKNRARFDRALERLDRIYERQPFLVGDRFSRVDLTAAALLAPMALPEQHPMLPPVRFPEEFEAYWLRQIDRPVIQRVLGLYRDYRQTQVDPV